MAVGNISEGVTKTSVYQTLWCSV